MTDAAQQRRPTLPAPTDIPTLGTCDPVTQLGCDDAPNHTPAAGLPDDAMPSHAAPDTRRARHYDERAEAWNRSWWRRLFLLPAPSPHRPGYVRRGRDHASGQAVHAPLWYFAVCGLMTSLLMVGTVSFTAGGFVATLLGINNVVGAGILTLNELDNTGTLQCSSLGSGPAVDDNPVLHDHAVNCSINLYGGLPSMTPGQSTSTVIRLANPSISEHVSARQLNALAGQCTATRRADGSTPGSPNLCDVTRVEVTVNRTHPAVPAATSAIPFTHTAGSMPGTFVPIAGGGAPTGGMSPSISLGETLTATVKVTYLNNANSGQGKGQNLRQDLTWQFLGD